MTEAKSPEHSIVESADQLPAEITASGSMVMRSHLNIEAVEEVLGEMKALQLDKCRNVTLDFSSVDVLTTPGLQVMTSLEKSLSEMSGTLSVVHVKPGVAGVFRDMGFERFLLTAS